MKKAIIISLKGKKLSYIEKRIIKEIILKNTLVIYLIKIEKMDF